MRSRLDREYYSKRFSLLLWFQTCWYVATVLGRHFEYMHTNTFADACTCEKASDGGLLPTETDFTTSH